MKGSELTRRAFFARSGAFLGGGWMATMLPDILATAVFVAESRSNFAFKVLTPSEVKDVDAISARIIPSGETPGASDAGAVRFIDRAFETFMSGGLPTFREGLEDLNESVRAKHPTATSFASLGADRQIEVLQESESMPFFGLVRFLTIAGTFSHPSYGGNQDKLGWKLLGFDDRHVWQPPFGAYEAD